LATAEELLGLGAVIQDNTESSCHINGFTIRIDVNILSGIFTSVTVDPLESEVAVGRRRIRRRVVKRLLNSSNPRLYSHELFTLASIDLIKEATLRQITGLVDINDLSGFFVECDSLFSIFHIEISTGSASHGGLSAAHVFS
jgi:hypothetical protein